MSNTTCILPFVHLYSEPKGEMKPCCIASGFDEPLNLKTLTIEEAFNSPQMKELRKDMLEGKRNKVCDVCYKKEDLNNHSHVLILIKIICGKCRKLKKTIRLILNFNI